MPDVQALCRLRPRPDFPFKTGDRITQDVVFDRDGIVAFATLAGDFNPLHHDEPLAKASRFKGLIASGTQTSSLMLGALATYILARAFAVGLKFSVRMKKAVRAGERATIAWEVVRIDWKASLGGDIVSFDGTLRNSDGVVAMTATSANLVFRPRKPPSMKPHRDIGLRNAFLAAHAEAVIRLRRPISD